MTNSISTNFFLSLLGSMLCYGVFIQDATKQWQLNSIDHSIFISNNCNFKFYNSFFFNFLLRFSTTLFTAAYFPLLHRKYL